MGEGLTPLPVTLIPLYAIQMYGDHKKFARHSFFYRQHRKVKKNLKITIDKFLRE